MFTAPLLHVLRQCVVPSTPIDYHTLYTTNYKTVRKQILHIVIPIQQISHLTVYITIQPIHT